MPNELAIDIADHEHIVCSAGNLFVQVWRQNPLEDRTKRMRVAAQRFLTRIEGPVAALVVVEEACKVPDDRARQHAIAFIRDLGARGKGIALVFEGEGFLAAASRAVMVGLVKAAGLPLPYKIVRTVDEAEAFLLPLLGGRWPHTEIKRVVESARGRIGEPEKPWLTG